MMLNVLEKFHRQVSAKTWQDWLSPIADSNFFRSPIPVISDQLWVNKDCRGQGLARQLMNRVHQLGKENLCTMATVSTMSFQNAVNFYKKLGYEKDFERVGHIKNSSCIFMRNNLNDTN